MAFDLGEALKGVSYSGTGREQIEYIHLDLIDGDPKNFYKLSDLDELAANIELCGLQQPIRLRPNPESPERYVVVSGHRRRAALAQLAADDPQRWSEVPCIVSRETVSPTLQQLQLIFANANTRKMTDAEISEQAAQVKDLLYKLKEEDGYEFPGRMRDHVAEIVKISKSKLARLEVIRKDLAAAWQPIWKSGTLAENTAYELSKMPKASQTLLFEEKSRTNANLKYLYADDVKKYAERCSAILALSCKEYGGDCSNYENKMRKAAVSERWGWFHCDNKCCKDCPELLRCKSACPKLADVIKQRKADQKAQSKQQAAEQAEKDRPVVEKISAIWQRFGLARELAGKEIDDCKKALNLYQFPFDAQKTMQLECGEAKITPETKLPFSYACSLSDISRIISLADLFECSIDWLLCRTDVKELTSTAVPDSGRDDNAPKLISSAWYPVSVEPPVGKKLILLDYHDFADEGVYKGSGLFSGRIDDEEPVRAWSLVPSDAELNNQTEPKPDSGWKSGSPDGYGTYAAYVQVFGAANPMLRELLWTGDEWLMFGQKISDDVTVQCWAERPVI